MSLPLTILVSVKKKGNYLLLIKNVVLFSELSVNRKCKYFSKIFKCKIKKKFPYLNITLVQC